MAFSSERLIEARNRLGITKAEAARRIQISAMAYGRYESGERVPSHSTILNIAQQLDVSPEYLECKTDLMEPEIIILSKGEDPELFCLVRDIKSNTQMRERILAYQELILHKLIH